MPKLIFTIPKREKLNENETKVVRVSSEFYNLLITISNETNLSHTQITEKIADYLIGQDAIEFKNEE